MLRGTLEAHGVEVLVRAETANDAAGPMLLVADSTSAHAATILSRAGVRVPNEPEALGLVPGGSSDAPIVLVSGSDERGIVYAVLELADRVAHAEDPLDAIRLEAPMVARPANAVRSVARLFTSEDDDKPWFHDEGFWDRYLSMLTAQRFNRFNLMVGLGYNFPWHVTDPYLYFAYPFLVDVPGFGVRVPQLPVEERERNLAMLRFVSDETVARGLDFQLGLWTHAFEWYDSPDARYTIEGLTPERHAAYCRDALGAMLDACPAIGGLTLRTHGESGIPERSWDFWRIVLDGVARAGRRVGIDLHAKGLDRRTLDIALATGQPVTVSPKYAAEHMGLPYHQAAMREQDRPPTPERRSHGDEGSVHGRQRGEPAVHPVQLRGLPAGGPSVRRRLPHLAGDAAAAPVGRSVDGRRVRPACEPRRQPGPRVVRASVAQGPRGNGTARIPRRLRGSLALAERRLGDVRVHVPAVRAALLRPGRGIPSSGAGRCARVSGPPRRAPRRRSRARAGSCRWSPTAHHPSASNNYYWPEIYTDMPIVRTDGSPDPHYYDTPEPKRFGTVTPLDPEIFSTVEEFVREAVAGEPSGRYSPLDVAAWLEELSSDAAHHLSRLEEGLRAATPQARRLAVDVSIQEALGRFFAGKLRAAVLYELWLSTGDPSPLPAALETYLGARAAWADAAERAFGVYVDDLTFGPQPWLRGTWADRLPAIDRDLEDLEVVARSSGTGDAVPASDVLRALADMEARSGSRGRDRLPRTAGLVPPRRADHVDSRTRRDARRSHEGATPIPPPGPIEALHGGRDDP